MIIGGNFTTALGAHADYIKRQNGSTWSGLAESVNGPVGPLAVLPNGDLIAAGGFTTAGGIISPYLARWTAICPVCDPDFDHDGSPGTDADIEAFFACLAGNCCSTCGSADFNGDGDTATDADIESFFRVLAGGSC